MLLDTDIFIQIEDYLNVPKPGVEEIAETVFCDKVLKSLFLKFLQDKIDSIQQKISTLDESKISQKRYRSLLLKYMKHLDELHMEFGWEMIQSPMDFDDEKLIKETNKQVGIFLRKLEEGV